MADFIKAYMKTKEMEGGYANLKGDRGGETIWGIARNFHENNRYLRDLWRELDNYKNSISNLEGKVFVNQLNALCNGNSQMQESAQEFYKKEFWYKVKGDFITEQKVAENAFDFFVNAGKNAIKTIQRVVGVNDDGIFGNKTLEAVNGYNGNLNEALVNARIKYYKGLNKPDFEKGWINRAEKFR